MKRFVVTKSGVSALATALFLSIACSSVAAADQSSAVLAGGASLASLQAVPAPAQWNDQTGQTALVTRSDGSRLAVPHHSLPAEAQKRFHRLTVAPSERLQVLVFSPETPVGGRATVIALDGGQLEEANGSQFFEFDVAADKNISFTFRAGATRGLHRVVVRCGSQEEIFQFWVGPELPVIVRTPTAIAQP